MEESFLSKNQFFANHLVEKMLKMLEKSIFLRNPNIHESIRPADASQWALRECWESLNILFCGSEVGTRAPLNNDGQG